MPALAPWPTETVIDKPGKGAFHATPLQAHLDRLGVTQLVVAGVTTEVCVQGSLREANDRGYEGLLVEAATASYFAHFKAATIEMIVAQGGIVGWAAPLAAVLSALPPAEMPTQWMCNHTSSAACGWAPHWPALSATAKRRARRAPCSMGGTASDRGRAHPGGPAGHRVFCSTRWRGCGAGGAKRIGRVGEAGCGKSTLARPA